MVFHWSSYLPPRTCCLISMHQFPHKSHRDQKSHSSEQQVGLQSAKSLSQLLCFYAHSAFLVLKSRQPLLPPPCRHLLQMISSIPISEQILWKSSYKLQLVVSQQQERAVASTLKFKKHQGVTNAHTIEVIFRTSVSFLLFKKRKKGKKKSMANLLWTTDTDIVCFMLRCQLFLMFQKQCQTCHCETYYCGFA